MTKLATTLFLAANSLSAALITVDLHPFGPANMISAGLTTPNGDTLQLADTPLNLNVLLGDVITVNYGTAILTVFDASINRTGELSVPFAFDVTKNGGAVVTQSATVIIDSHHNQLVTFPVPQPPAFDFGDGTSFALIITSFSVAQADPGVTVPLIGKAAYFVTGQSPVPELSAWTMTLSGIAILLVCRRPLTLRRPPA